jgi:hypothetical protein
MPDGSGSKSEVRSEGGALRAETGANPPTLKNPHAPPPAWEIALIVLVVVAAAGALWYWLRRGAIRAWQTYARQIDGEFEARNRLAPASITGKLRGRDFVLSTSISHEDEAPYYHTRGCVPLRNAASFVLGLRHKSLLEEGQTRGQKPTFDLEDPEFERSFFLICNDAQSLATVLTPEARKELSRYSDVEIYVRFNLMEWRRAGEVNDVKALQRLSDLVAEMAETVDALPPRARTLSERLADEALIAKGV